MAKESKMEKKTYVKPEINEVRLVPAEAVLSVCKTGVTAACFPFVNCANEPGS